MPKSRTRKSRTSNVSEYSAVKFKIGGRKSNRSALRMSTEELQEALASGSTRGRDKNKIRQVLDQRGVAA